MPLLLKVDLSQKMPCPDAHPNPEDLYRLYDLPNFGFYRGERYMSKWGRVRVVVNDDPECPKGLTDYFETVPFSIVSAKMVALFRAFDADCEYLPLEVDYDHTWYKDEFFALNVLSCVPLAVDREHSKFTTYGYDLLENVERLVLKQGALGGAPIARLDELVKTAVSDELAAALAASGMRGFALVPPEKFTS